MFDFSFQSISNNFCIKKIKKYKFIKKKESLFQCDYVNVIYKFIRQELRTREKVERKLKNTSALRKNKVHSNVII